MSPHLKCVTAALKARADAAELLLASRAALKNAELLEEIVCTGSDAEVEEAARAVDVWSLMSEQWRGRVG